MILDVIVLVFLIICSAIFSATETAYTSLSMLQIQELSIRKGKAGKLVAKLSAKPDILLTTILIGNNLVNIGASALATLITIALVGSHAIGITTGVMTLIILIFAEVTPKQLAIVHNETISLHMAFVIKGLSILLYPIIRFIGLLSHIIVRFFATEKKHKISLQGILHMVHLAEHMGVVENYETGMIKSVFRFNDVSVQAIMTHRTDVFSLDIKTVLIDVLPLITEKGFSRIPVYRDHPENIVGILLVKNIMKKVALNQCAITLKEIKIPPIFISEKRKVNELLFLFKREKLNIAIVLDEYGGLAGIVTLEDVAEELLGELYDEHENMGWENITSLSSNKFRIKGDTPLLQIKDKFGIDFSHGKDIQTIGGYLIEHLGNIPQKEQKIETDFGDFIVETKKRNRITSLIFILNNNNASYD